MCNLKEEKKYRILKSFLKLDMDTFIRFVDPIKSIKYKILKSSCQKLDVSLDLNPIKPLYLSLSSIV